MRIGSSVNRFKVLLLRKTHNGVLLCVESTDQDDQHGGSDGSHDREGPCKALPEGMVKTSFRKKVFVKASLKQHLKKYADETLDSSSSLPGKRYLCGKQELSENANSLVTSFCPSISKHRLSSAK